MSHGEGRSRRGHSRGEEVLQAGLTTGLSLYGNLVHHWHCGRSTRDWVVDGHSTTLSSTLSVEHFGSAAAGVRISSRCVCPRRWPVSTIKNLEVKFKSECDMGHLSSHRTGPIPLQAFMDCAPNGSCLAKLYLMQLVWNDLHNDGHLQAPCRHRRDSNSPRCGGDTTAIYWQGELLTDFTSPTSDPSPATHPSDLAGNSTATSAGATTGSPIPVWTPSSVQRIPVQMPPRVSYDANTLTANGSAPLPLPNDYPASFERESPLVRRTSTKTVRFADQAGSSGTSDGGYTISSVGTGELSLADSTSSSSSRRHHRDKRHRREAFERHARR